MPVTAIIVDDEPLAADGLRCQCEASGSVDVVGVAANGAVALNLIDIARPQVVFLDIAMPGVSGLDVAAALARTRNPPLVVLVTAHDNFATEAFDLRVVDYVLKPVDPGRLARAIDRLEGTLASADAGSARLCDLWLPFQGTVLRVPIDDVTLLQAERDYVRVHDRHRSYLVRSTLGDILDRAGADFARIHRSTALPLARVAGLRRTAGGWEAVDADGRAHPVGRAFLAGLRTRLGLDWAASS